MKCRKTARDVKSESRSAPDWNAEGRQVYLSNQQYIEQPLFDVDKRYANDPAFLFSATSYIENLQLERKVSMSYTHGSKKVVGNEFRTYQVNNPFRVLKKISNTPEYWKVKKMELLSKLDNKGPFQFFFILSSADARWEENFTALTYETNNLTNEIKALVTIGDETIALEDYLKDKRFCND